MKFEKLFCKIDESQNNFLLKDIFIKNCFNITQKNAEH